MTLPRKLRGGYPSAPSLPIRLCPIFRSSTRFQGNLEQILEWPFARAKKALKLFPSIRDPGAEKILLFCGVAAELLQIQRELVDRRQKTIVCPTLARAHMLLRAHGKTICCDGQPLCHECPVEEGCAFRNPGASKVPRNIPGTGD